jgi:uncharacterized membrane protein
MNIPTGVLANSWAVSLWIIAALILMWAVKTAPWHKIKGDAVAQRVFGATVILIYAMWSVKAAIGPGLGFHFLLATVVTLMFGWQFALLAFSLVISALTILGGAGWDAWGANFITLAVAPVAVTWVALLLSYRHLPRHFFVYTFLNAFLVGALSMVASVVLLSIVLVWGDVISWERLSYQFLPMLPMMAAPEAFLNGFIMTVLIVNRVEWVSTFTDEQYIKGK